MGQDCCAQRHPQRSSLAQVNRNSQRLSFQREKQLSAKKLNEIDDDYIVKDNQQYLRIDEKKREDQPLFKKVQSQSIIEEEIQVIELSNANKPETLFEGNSESKDNLERPNQLEDQQAEISIQMGKAATQTIEEEKQLTRSSITKHLASSDYKSEIKSIEALKTPEPLLIEKINIVDSQQKDIATNVQGQKEQKSLIQKQTEVYKAQDIYLEAINIENKCLMTEGEKQQAVSNPVPLVLEEKVLSQTPEKQSQIIEKNAQSNNRAYETQVSQVLKSQPIQVDFVQNNQPEIAVPLEQISFSTNFNTVQSLTSNIEQRLKNKMQPGKLNLRFLRALEQSILGKEINQKEEEPIIQVIERPMPKNIRPRKNIKLVI